MAKGKIYYWIKLKDSFLTSDKVDFLMGQKDGANYIVLYQMLCLKCMNTGGLMARKIGEMLIPFDVDKVVRDCKYFSKDTVIVALELYKKLGMVYQQEDGFLRIVDFENMVGRETDYAKKMRDYREGQKRLQCSQDVTYNVGENVSYNVRQENRDKRLEKREKKLDKEKEREMPDSDESDAPAKAKKPVKHKYGEYKNVLLTDEELEKLKTEYSDFENRIERLSAYVASTGKAYKSHYATIRNWARKDAETGRKEVVPKWIEKPNRFNSFAGKQDYDIAALEEELLANGIKTAGNDAGVAARAEELKRRLK